MFKNSKGARDPKKEALNAAKEITDILSGLLDNVRRNRLTKFQKKYVIVDDYYKYCIHENKQGINNTDLGIISLDARMFESIEEVKEYIKTHAFKNKSGKIKLQSLRYFELLDWLEHDYETQIKTIVNAQNKAK